MARKKLPRVLAADERDDLLAVFNTRYISGLKNLCMARVMIEAGLRVSEVCDLRPRDLNMHSCKLQVRDGKGGKDRNLWVTHDLRDLIGEWLDRRPDSTWLYPTRSGSRTSPRSVRRMVKNYATKAGIGWADELSPHTLRHSFATELLGRTGNIRLVQKALGHADLSTTMIYTHIVDADLEAALKGEQDE